MRNYFKGNTRQRRMRMRKIHSKFAKRQRAWMVKSLARNLKYWKK